MTVPSAATAPEGMLRRLDMAGKAPFGEEHVAVMGGVEGGPLDRRERRRILRPRRPDGEVGDLAATER